MVRTNKPQLVPTLIAIVSAFVVSAAPVPADVEDQIQATACAFTCGSVCYQSSHIQSALNKGYSLQQGGDDISQCLCNTFPYYSSNHSALHLPFELQCLSNNSYLTDNYPHRYNNYEGFDFPTSSPWYEYPIMSNHNVYTGGSPGPDRVVFDANGAFDLLITHTGASGNNFVSCRAG